MDRFPLQPDKIGTDSSPAGSRTNAAVGDHQGSATAPQLSEEEDRGALSGSALPALSAALKAWIL